MVAQGKPPQWRISARSSGGNCVEVMTRAQDVLVRDSKRRDGGVLTFERGAFADFLGAVKDGEFDVS